MSEIFVSYRRDDGHAAGRIALRLQREFPIFFDTDIPPGARFDQKIEEGLARAKVVFAILGKGWFSSRNLKRLQKEDDWVRAELARALNREGVRVVPVIVDEGIQMPAARQLPHDLQLLTLLDACRLHHDSWDDDLEDLIDDIRPGLRSAVGAKTAPPDLSSEIAHFCDRGAQAEGFAEFAAKSLAANVRMPVCVLPGHKFEVHTGVVTRLRLDEKLSEALGAAASGVDVHALEWSSQKALDGKYDDLLLSALKAGVLKSFVASDDSLFDYLRTAKRPSVMTMLVTWSDLDNVGHSFIKEVAAAWNRLAARLGGEPSQPLLLWINVSYEDGGQKADCGTLDCLPPLMPLINGDIERWVDREEVRPFVTRFESRLLGIARDSNYYVTAGKIHMRRFIDAIRDLQSAKDG